MDQTAMGAKKKVAVLGGGVGAMAAAFELTESPNWKEEFESITVYQLGWRLGGKGASGRGPYGRIEEHGLHLWMGFYENSFRAIQKAYLEMGRQPDQPLATWRDAFHPHSNVVVYELHGGIWKPWVFEFPTNGGLPGTGGPLPTLWEYLQMIVGWIHETFSGLEHARCEGEPNLPGWVSGILARALVTVETACLGIGAVQLRTALELMRALPRDPHQHPSAHHQWILRLLDEALAWFRRELQAHVDANDSLRRNLILFELGASVVRGIIADGVLFHEDGLSSVDAEDFRVWLARHRASAEVCNSAVVQGLYDLVFAYDNGEIARPNFAAGAALRSTLRIVFTYKGAIFWKMQAGMGDTVFVPFYDALRKRGVRFRFFHRVKNLGLAEDGTRIGSIVIGRQVTLKNGSYDPLVPINDLPCWPSQPLYDQIVEGNDLQQRQINLESFWTPWEDVEEITLRDGVDFDAVVLGISIGSIPYLCAELVQASPAWQSMVGGVQTVRTMAAQLWLARDLEGLGWPGSSPIMDAYVEPLNTWGDMSHLLPREQWPPEAQPQNIAYFCGPMVGDVPSAADRQAPSRTWEEVKDAARAWFGANTGAIWPRVVRVSDPAALDYRYLTAPGATSEDARFSLQFFRANIDPSERYVLSLAGSTRWRLAPSASGFTNLVLAGDWTLGFNAGCVEAAMMSGMQAARAILRDPGPVQVIGEDHA